MADVTVPTFSVSVVVPVHNRAEELSVLLDSLIHQTLDPHDYEIIVCDDGSDDDIQDVVNQVRDKCQHWIRYFYQRQRGLGSARNLGLQQANGRLVAFTDSDCVADPHWLAELLTPFATPNVGIAGGAIRPHSQSPIVSQCSNWLMSTIWAGGARDPRSTVSMDYCPRAGNLAVRSELARQCGGFPDRRHGEDIEFSLRIRALGVSAEFAPKAVILHNEQRSLSQIFAEAVCKGRARTRVWRRMKKIEILHAVPSMLVIYLLALLLAVVFLPSSWALVSAIPLMLYGVVNALIGIQARALFSSWQAMIVAPTCSVLMHLGYGSGFLVGLTTMNAAGNTSIDEPSSSSKQIEPHTPRGMTPEAVYSGAGKK